MSRGACISLGISLGILALGFLGVAWFIRGLEGMRAATTGMVILAIFSGIGAFACLVPASRPVALRLVGGTVFLACLAYMAKMLISGPLLGRSRADQSLVNSLCAFTVFGLPAGYVAIKGQYPRWGQHAHALGAAKPRIPDTPPDNSGL